MHLFIYLKQHFNQIYKNSKPFLFRRVLQKVKVMLQPEADDQYRMNIPLRDQETIILHILGTEILE